jgi:hypothetical protein
MTRKILAGAAVAVGIGLCAQAQEGANFSGTWVMDMTRSESAAQASTDSPRIPVRLEITHSPSSVTIRTLRDGSSETVSYSFERPNQDVVRTGDNSTERRVINANARWDGPILETQTVYSVNGMATTKVEKYRLSGGGREMIVESELQMQHGYESNGRGPAGYGAAKDVYVKDSR